jgi:hypothetical protein
MKRHISEYGTTGLLFLYYAPSQLTIFLGQTVFNIKYALCSGEHYQSFNFNAFILWEKVKGLVGI